MCVPGCIKIILHSLRLKGHCPQGPHSHILMTGGGGPSDFFGSEILAKSDFLGSMKDAGIFLGRGKKNQGFLGVAKKD